MSLQPDFATGLAQAPTSAAAIAGAVAGRKVSALEIVESALARIKQHDTILNSFTDVTAERARAKACAVDAAIKSTQVVIMLFSLRPTLADFSGHRAPEPTQHDGL